MKTFIYLPLIALLVLTGCKSNKFTTQRYTNFAHSSHKKSTNEKLVVQKINPVDITQPIVETENVDAKIEKKSLTPVTLIASGFSTLSQTFLKSERKVYDLSSNSATSSSTEETINTDDLQKTTLNSEKMLKRRQKSEGFIGSALATALWIVLVVIFIILIIFLITVIF